MNQTFERRWYWWFGLAIALVLPWIFYNWTDGRHSGFSLTLMSEIGLLIVFALSYNMLMGQAGLLSFGHAALFGLGGYTTAHALNAIAEHEIWFPVELVPLAGGLGGLAAGVTLGYLATKQRSTAFAMITLGLGELITAAALMFMLFFGGEGGVSTNRVIDASLFGVEYAQSIDVYYLIVAWGFISIWLMRLLTQTPLGRMANAQRDNFERTQFVGYDPRLIRFYQFVLAGFFAGVAGGLFAMLHEIVTFDAVAAQKSATALLATYIGGIGGFFGPVVGAIVVVLMQSGISLLSSAWLLYLGTLFVLIVMYAPGGLTGIIAEHAPIARIGRLKELFVPYLRLLLPGLLCLAGFVLLVETASFMSIGASQGKDLSFAGYSMQAGSWMPWIASLALLVVGGLWLKAEARVFSRTWNVLMEAAKAELASAQGGRQ
ncbi:branched-chain amino acid ABC transporter permease [Quisquiliibacterium transsilvanicum]|uniref:Branched-chain amino acid transport system permease protein n=1 Tax=Quisquiliibacterium transsilvanicum TaxID=1549638 RepID=A0A7W8HGH1_9BURK|nr:branched-chain amino acid ABC transporter permease [Quisquiliibacterium transsilvanicum]MBB5271402.1 branched-chain amino acid transport system permease protein [Quisquiliibacterium transsilvanicum]